MQAGAAISLLILGWVQAAVLADFDNIVIFGDSLSDFGGPHGLESLVDEATDSDVVRLVIVSALQCTTTCQLTPSHTQVVLIRAAIWQFTACNGSLARPVPGFFGWVIYTATVRLQFQQILQRPTLEYSPELGFQKETGGRCSPLVLACVPGMARGIHTSKAPSTATDPFG